MACAGDGTFLPPFVIYRSLHLWDIWTTGGLKGTWYGHTKSGWIDHKTFEEWFLSMAVPYLRKQDPPRVLIGDNLSSHLSQFVIKKCEEYEIRFVFLLKNSRHLCQPLDVFFQAIQTTLVKHFVWVEIKWKSRHCTKGQISWNAVGQDWRICFKKCSKINRYQRCLLVKFFIRGKYGYTIFALWSIQNSRRKST